MQKQVKTAIRVCRLLEYTEIHTRMHRVPEYTEYKSLQSFYNLQLLIIFLVI